MRYSAKVNYNLFMSVLGSFVSSGMPIYLVKSTYENFVDVFKEGNIGLDIAQHAKEGGTIINMR